jgi:hypothetical protein
MLARVQKSFPTDARHEDRATLGSHYRVIPHNYPTRILVHNYNHRALIIWESVFSLFTRSFNARSFADPTGLWLNANLSAPNASLKVKLLKGD